MKDNGKKPVIAFFDLDGTLLDGTNGNIYARLMIRNGQMKARGAVWVLWYTILYKMNRLPRVEVYKRVLDVMGQFTVFEMIEGMDVGFESHIMPRLYKEGADLVREHNDKGHVTVIATAAGEYVAERVRAQLGARDVIATPIPIKCDHMTSELLGPMSFMEGKLEMAKDLCTKYGAELADCYFYSDSASDLPLLEAVGNPVLVNPQLKLRQATRGRGWPVLKFKEYAGFTVAARPVSMMSEPMDRFSREYEVIREARLSGTSRDSAAEPLPGESP